LYTETLQQIRRHLARFLLSVPPEAIETAYTSELGQVYRTLLKSNLQAEPLSSEDEQLKQQLTQLGAGLTQPNAVNAVLGAMLFYPADQLKVRDAQTRLPAWLYPDYAAVFEAGATVTVNAQTVTAQAVTTPTMPTVPAATTTTATPDLTAVSVAAEGGLPELPPVFQQDPTSIAFTNRAIGCANLYYIDPSEQEIVAELHQIRLHLARYLMTVETSELERLWTTNVGEAYRALLKSEFRQEALTADSETYKQELTQIGAGLTQPKSLNALMGAMLFYPTGQMKVRDAQTRLPAWLYRDYAAVFETDTPSTPVEASPMIANTQPIAPSAPTPTPAPPTPTTSVTPANPTTALPAPAANTYMPELEVTSAPFLNRLLGSVNLYHIDPTDLDICNELRKIRRRFSDYWLTIETAQLETVYQGDLGRGFKLLLGSGFQKEPLDSDEEQYKQAITQVAVGLQAPKSLNAMMVAMLYYPTDKLRVQDAETRLPAWLLGDYKNIFEGKTPEVQTLDVQPPSAEFFQRLSNVINLFNANKNDAQAITQLRQLRHAFAQYWLNVEPSQLPSLMAGTIGNAQRQLIASGFAAIEKTPLDRQAFQQLSSVLGQGLQASKAINYFLAAMLYCRPDQLKLDNPEQLLPAWLVGDYRRFFSV